jgi:hypothetical protein
MSLPPPFVLKMDRPTVGPDGELIMFTLPIRDLKSALEWFKGKMVINEALAGAADGVYTWLLKEGGLVALPVESEQEIGSVHANLWSWTPSMGRVVAAGELRKQGATLDYNLQSGSFMKPYLKTVDIQQRLVAAVSKRFRELGLMPFFLKCNPNGIVDCTHRYETLSGKSIIDETPIVTPSKDLFFYRAFFTEKQLDRPGSMGGIARSMANEPVIGGRRGRSRKTRGRTRRTRVRRRASI